MDDFLKWYLKWKKNQVQKYNILISGPRAEIWALQYTDARDSSIDFQLRSQTSVHWCKPVYWHLVTSRAFWSSRTIPDPQGINKGPKVVEECLVVVPWWSQTPVHWHTSAYWRLVTSNSRALWLSRTIPDLQGISIRGPRSWRSA